MPIYKRGSTWWIDIQPPVGERIRKSTGTKNKKQAQEYHDKLKADLWKLDKLEQKPERIFEEAILLMLKDGENQARFDYKQSHAEYFLNIFSGRILSSISSEEINDALPTHQVRNNKPITPATQNRYRTTVLRAFSLAHQMGWIDKVPFVPKKKEADVRVRWITKEQAQCLISNLSLDWMKLACTFALLTGARMSEILSLTWSNVDLVRKIAIVTSDNAKSGKARALLLNDQALDLIMPLRFKSQYVFTRNTLKRITEIDRRDFYRACGRSGIEDFHFHDLRHTWASWHVQSGTPLFTLKELGGWETLEMVKKYAHLNADHMLVHANHVTFTTQNNDVTQKTGTENQ